MKVCCPELRDVYAEDVFGLFLYRHEDDESPCDYLNMFHVTPKDILKRYIGGSTFACTPGTVAALRSSEEVRAQLCEELQNAPTLDILAEKIMQIYNFCVEMKNFQLCEQLHREFGIDFFNNVRLVSGRRTISGNYRVLDYQPRYTIKKLDMRYSPISQSAMVVKSAQEGSRRTADKLYEALTSAKAKKK